jgi:hypothetical protein
MNGINTIVAEFYGVLSVELDFVNHFTPFTRRQASMTAGMQSYLRGGNP